MAQWNLSRLIYPFMVVCRKFEPKQTHYLLCAKKIKKGNFYQFILGSRGGPLLSEKRPGSKPWENYSLLCCLFICIPI